MGIHSGLSDRFSALYENRQTYLAEEYNPATTEGYLSQRSESPGNFSTSSDDSGDDWPEHLREDAEVNTMLSNAASPSAAAASEIASMDSKATETSVDEDARQPSTQKRRHGQLERHQAVEIRISECSDNLPCFETRLINRDDRDLEKRSRLNNEPKVEFRKGIL